MNSLEPGIIGSDDPRTEGATLLEAVNFYDQRFSIGFTDQQREDLVNFLNTL
jgi:hypothetical protein